MANDGRRFGLTLLGLGLVSGSVLAGQILLSRLLSATAGNDYAFMLVSLAMLGLGSGGLVVRQFPEAFAQARMNAQASMLAIGMSLSCVLGVVAIIHIYPQVIFGDRWTLIELFWAAFPFFLCSGTLVSLVLVHSRERFYFVYAVDLGSAAVGCLAALLAGSVTSPPEALLVLVALAPALASSAFALADRRFRLALVSVATLMGVALAGQALVAFSLYSDPTGIYYLARNRLLLTFA